MMRRIVVSLVFLLVIALCAGVIWFNFFREKMIGEFFAKMQPPAQVVSAAPVAAREWTPGITAIGTARAGNGVELAFQVGGVVKEIRFKPNQSVNTGDVLVQLDDATERADLIDARAAVTLYESTVGRSRELTSRGFGTQASNDQATAQLATARSRLTRTNSIIEQKALKAPFSGVIGIARIDIGQYLQAGTVVATLQDLKTMKIEFTVPEQLTGKLSLGQAVRFGMTEADLPFSGRILGIDPRIDPKTRLVTVQASLDDNPGNAVMPGRFLHVRVELPKEPGVTTVPQTAVVTSLYGDFVYVAAEEEKDGQKRVVARQTFVKIGRREGRESEVVSGLTPGQMVVTAGQNKLQSGSAVKIDNTIDITKAPQPKS